MPLEDNSYHPYLKAFESGSNVIYFDNAEFNDDNNNLWRFEKQGDGY